MASGKELLNREVSNLETDWKSLAGSAYDITDSLKMVLDLWRQFDVTHNALLEWMTCMERQLKELSLVSTLEEKEQRLTTLKVSNVSENSLLFSGLKKKILTIIVHVGKVDICMCLY